MSQNLTMTMTMTMTMNNSLLHKTIHQGYRTLKKDRASNSLGKGGKKLITKGPQVHLKSYQYKSLSDIRCYLGACASKMG